MKTYTVLLPVKPCAALVAVVDSMLTGFALAVLASSNYHWRNLNLSSTEVVRWFDTDCDNAAMALKRELSNIGVRVEPQKCMVQNPEDWDIYVEQKNSETAP